jgi:hypothetical protein
MPSALTPVTTTGALPASPTSAASQAENRCTRKQLPVLRPGGHSTWVSEAITPEAEQAMQNLKHVVEHNDSSLARVVN